MGHRLYRGMVRQHQHGVEVWGHFAHRRGYHGLTDNLTGDTSIGVVWRGGILELGHEGRQAGLTRGRDAVPRATDAYGSDKLIGLKHPAIDVARHRYGHLFLDKLSLLVQRSFIVSRNRIRNADKGDVGDNQH